MSRSLHPLWAKLSPDERHIRIERLLATPRPAFGGAPWRRRESELSVARFQATPEDAARIQSEVRAMWDDRRAAEDRINERRRPFREADAAALDHCPMRDSTVRGLDAATTQGRRLCWLDGKPIPPRRQRWCSDECVRLWTNNHEWSAASFTVVRRDRACVRCGSTRRPEVNHRDPLVGRGYHQGCHHHLDGLERLCHACHVAETTRQARERRADAVLPDSRRSDA